ncbi:unnamed protein product [Larinioides sclopetarius]|uniref:DDE Tnp4 domain-containing protein n=1 Tax=Larinioides sclopetarius TaxID=280406 RepID=A0AAV2BWY0_9ARAC
MDAIHKQCYGLEGVLGTVDCTHVAIIALSNVGYHHESNYVNIRGWHSINVQLVCDSNLRILNVVARFPGCTPDSGNKIHGDSWLLGKYPTRKEEAGHQDRDETGEDIREAFVRSPTQSISRASRDLGVHDVLRKGLNFSPYNVQLLQALNPGGLNCRFNFAIDMLERIDADFLRKIIFIDEATFHLSGTVNR